MKIFEKLMEMVRSVCRLSRKVQQHDPDLARQMRRACQSVALNMLEGWHGRAGNRIARFHDAMGSARETVGCLHIAAAVGYLRDDEVSVDLDSLDHFVAVLWKLSRTKR
jgi:four helix bundle protein